MHLQQATYTNFRNFQNLDLKNLGPGFVVLWGVNGAGKTNFLEGVYFGATLRRFPETKLSQLFYDEENYFRLKLRLVERTETRFQEVFAERGDGNIIKFQIDSQAFSRSKYQAVSPVISFLPQDLNLLTRSPEGRRRYFNETLSLRNFEYRFFLSQYQKTLKQRNELLLKITEGRAKESELEIWDEKLVEFGSQITNLRSGLIEYINRQIAAPLQSFAPEFVKPRLVYANSAPLDKTEYRNRLVGARALEQKVLTSVLGPHRDDFVVYCGGRAAVGFVSRGQLRSITLALKLLEKQYLEQNLQTSPILLLDDVFSEFDTFHRQMLIELLRGGQEQVFITTAQLEETQAALPKEAQIYKIEKGVIFPHA